MRRGSTPHSSRTAPSSALNMGRRASRATGPPCGPRSRQGGSASSSRGRSPRGAPTASSRWRQPPDLARSGLRHAPAPSPEWRSGLRNTSAGCMYSDTCARTVRPGHLDLVHGERRLAPSHGEEQRRPLRDAGEHEVELALIVRNGPDALVCQPPSVSTTATRAGREALRPHRRRPGLGPYCPSRRARRDSRPGPQA
jgi:hypothetical protein